MSIQTLGEAFAAHWKVSVTCDGCDIRSERIDMRALLWTRGRAFPLDSLKDRLRCPRCGSRTVRVAFDVPGRPNAGASATDPLATPDRYWIQQLDVRGAVVDTLKRDRFDSAVRCFEREVSRRRGCRFVMRDGARVVREWPERDT